MWSGYKHGILTSTDTLTGDAAQAINGNFTTIGNLFDTALTAPATPTLNAVLTAGHTSNLDITIGSGGTISSPDYYTLGGDLFANNLIAFSGGSQIGDDGSGNMHLSGASINLPSPTLTGTPTAPTATAGTSTTQIATCAFVAAAAVSQLQIVLSSQVFS